MIKIISPSRCIVNKPQIIKEAEKALLIYKPNPAFVLNIIFIGSRKMAKIARKYKKENTVFPVLSFSYLKEAEEPVDNEETVIGEIFICYPQAVLLAAEKDKTVDGMIDFLVHHGIENIFEK